MISARDLIICGVSLKDTYHEAASTGQDAAELFEQRIKDNGYEVTKRGTFVDGIAEGWHIRGNEAA